MERKMQACRSVVVKRAELKAELSNCQSICIPTLACGHGLWEGTIECDHRYKGFPPKGGWPGCFPSEVFQARPAGTGDPGVDS